MHYPCRWTHMDGYVYLSHEGLSNSYLLLNVEVLRLSAEKIYSTIRNVYLQYIF